MATWRALALLTAHPGHLERAREEARTGDRHRLPFLRAAVLESLRLWPTAPLILRETNRATQWDNGRMPAGTTVVLLAPFFHRDDEHLPFAHRFEPELWMDDAAPGGVRPIDPMDWPLIPFSSGSGMCPGRHVVLLVASNMLAELLDDRRVRITSPGRLDAHEPMPGSFDPYTLRFPVQG
jgi:cytochrome P450